MALLFLRLRDCIVGIIYKVVPISVTSCIGDVIIEKNIAFRTLDGISLTSISTSKSNPLIVRNNFVSGQETLLALSRIPTSQTIHLLECLPIIQ